MIAISCEEERGGINKKVLVSLLFLPLCASAASLLFRLWRQPWFALFALFPKSRRYGIQQDVKIYFFEF